MISVDLLCKLASSKRWVLDPSLPACPDRGWRMIWVVGGYVVIPPCGGMFADISSREAQDILDAVNNVASCTAHLELALEGLSTALGGGSAE